MPSARDLVEAAQLGPLEEERLTRNLYRRKANEYRQTLLALGKKHGLQRSRVLLSPEIRAALEQEAADHARSVIDTYNGLVEEFIRRRQDAGASTEQIIRELPAYMRERKQGRLATIDNTATVTSRLDAQVGFYRENGVDPHFRFVGKVTSSTCALCKALLAAESFPIETVLAIGIPHIGCTHRWRARETSAEELRRGGVKEGEITLGRGQPQGIVGARALDMRTGSINAAADFVRERSEPELIQQFDDVRGRTTALSRESAEHIARRRPSFAGHFPDAIEAVKDPDARTRDSRGDPQVEVFWKRGTGPSEWMRVVVKFVPGDRGYIVSVRGDRRGPGEDRL